MLYTNGKWEIVDLKQTLRVMHCVAIGTPNELITSLPVQEDLVGWVDGFHPDLTIVPFGEHYRITRTDGRKDDDGIFLILSSEGDARLRAPIGQENEVLYRTSLALVLEAKEGDIFRLDRGPMEDLPNTFYVVSNTFVDEVAEYYVDYLCELLGVKAPPSEPDKWKLV